MTDTTNLCMSGPGPDLLSPVSTEALMERISTLSKSTDEAIKEALSSHIPFIDEVCRYIIFSGGKRLRPVLFMLAAQALGKDAEPGYAAIFEYLHAASLLHDDVVDKADLRRGRPSANNKYGNEPVILVGDFLFSKSYSLCAEIPDQRLVQIITDCTTKMAEGQVLEYLNTGNLELDLPVYMQIITAKTAILISAACYMGGLYATQSQEIASLLDSYGRELGIAFQITDDALDYTGTREKFGKPVGHDLEEGKATLPFIHVRDNAAPAVRKELLALAKAGLNDPNALEQARELVRQQGGVDAAMKAAREHALAAQQALLDLPENRHEEHVDMLMSLACYVVTRDN